MQINILDSYLLLTNYITPRVEKKPFLHTTAYLKISEFFIDDEVENSKYKYVINKEVEYRLNEKYP